MPSSVGHKEVTAMKESSTVLDMHSVCSGRSGWKSSQADIINRVSRAVPSLMEGEGCVNTHTGSVSVAGSQSNIVLQESVEGESSVNTHTGSVRVAASQSNIVNEEECVSKSVCPKYAKQVNVNNGENVQAELSRVGCGDDVQDGVGCKMSCAKHECDMLSAKNPYSIVVKHNEGNLGSNTEHVASKPPLKSLSRSKPISTSTLRLRDYFNTI